MNTKSLKIVAKIRFHMNSYAPKARLFAPPLSPLVSQLLMRNHRHAKLAPSKESARREHKRTRGGGSENKRPTVHSPTTTAHVYIYAHFITLHFPLFLCLTVHRDINNEALFSQAIGDDVRQRP